jgi:uncharacterized protein YxeA
MLSIKPTNTMKKIIYVLILLLIVVCGLVFSFKPFAYDSGANREIKNETSKKSIPKLLSAAEKKAVLKKWEATPDGIMYKKWEASPAGKKVHVSATKISKSVKNYTNMEGVVTSLSLPPGSRLGFGLMIRINGDDYILAFGPEKFGKNSLNTENEFEQLHRLKVADKIIIRSHSISQAPKYFYPILSGDYVERDHKIIYKRAARKGGC